MSTAEMPQQLPANEKPKPPSIKADSRGLKLTSLDEMYRFAQYVASSGLAPKGVETPQAILVAIQMGAELGLTPMQSLQNVAVINGRPSVWGDAQLAICRASGLFDEEAFREIVTGDGDKMTATCTVRRLPNGQPTSQTFSVADAACAGLWKKAGPWQQYPKRMLQLRARGFALRDAFSDVLKGVPVAEELRDQAASIVLQPTDKPPQADPLDALADEIASPAPDPPKPTEAEKPSPDEREMQIQSLFDGRDTLSSCKDLAMDLLSDFPDDGDLIQLICEARIDQIRAEKGKQKDLLGG